MPPERTRRAFLASAATLTAGLAGCAATPPQNVPTEEPQAEPTPELPRDMEQAYAAVYRDTIDSVGLVRVSGPGTSSQGSGFVYGDNHLVTNEHVVDGGSSFQVEFREGEWSEAELLGVDAYSDLAILDMVDRPVDATPLEFVDEPHPTGTPVMALGAPFGLSQTVTSGIISGRERALPAESGFQVPDAIQTDAAVNPGNSGGPLLDLNGDVVGVVTAGGGDNIGFAVSAAVCERVLPALLAEGEFAHPYMGVRLENVSPAIAAANDLESARGVMVVDTITDGPADGVLRPAPDSTVVDGRTVPIGGDVIVGMGYRETPSVAQVSRYLILETNPEDVLTVTVLRDGSRTTVDLELGRRPEG